MRLPWLQHDDPFPPVEQALIEPPGLLAAGANLSIPRLRQAYSQGVFPWFNAGEPILWWSPDPRMVLGCDSLHLSHSLRKKLRQIARHQASGNMRVVVTIDCAFESVMAACAQTPRHGVQHTWITHEMRQAYQAWHLAGQVHSIETWMDGELAGGLYGVCLGNMFFGESMFAWKTDASKIALAHLVKFLDRSGCALIDCQMETAHLASLGARIMARDEFCRHVRHAVAQPQIHIHPGWMDELGRLHPLTRDAQEAKPAT